jgi:hypothetical protein
MAACCCAALCCAGHESASKNKIRTSKHLVGWLRRKLTRSPLSAVALLLASDPVTQAERRCRCTDSHRQSLESWTSQQGWESSRNGRPSEVQDSTTSQLKRRAPSHPLDLISHGLRRGRAYYSPALRPAVQRGHVAEQISRSCWTPN